MNTSRIKRLVTERRDKRQNIIEEENKRRVELSERFDNELWTLDKLEEMEFEIKQKKQELKETEGLKVTDSDVDI